jgi:hypothetical protein
VRSGDRVKLTAKAALGAASVPSNTRGLVRVDWAARRGTIMSANHGSALIKWDDRKTLDQWPNAALEECE